MKQKKFLPLSERNNQRKKQKERKLYDLRTLDKELHFTIKAICSCIFLIFPSFFSLKTYDINNNRNEKEKQRDSRKRNIVGDIRIIPSLRKRERDKKVSRKS